MWQERKQTRDLSEICRMSRSASKTDAMNALCVPKERLEQMFWPLVAVGAQDECWPWLGRCSKNGKGLLTVHGEKRVQTLSAQRIALWLAGKHKSSRTSRLFVRCGLHSCINVAHLRVEDRTQSTNEPPYIPLHDIEARFSATGGTRQADGCLLWKGGMSANGYGQITVKTRNGLLRHIGAHRVAIYVHSRIWPQSGEFVCHHCDTPQCVEPAHLYVGDAQTNANDAVRRKRLVSPEALAKRAASVDRGCLETEKRRLAFAANRVLSAELAASIKNEYTQQRLRANSDGLICGCTHNSKSLQRLFACSEDVVRDAIKHKAVGAKPDTAKRFNEIRDLFYGPMGHGQCLESGRQTKPFSYAALAKKYGTSPSTIVAAVLGHRRARERARGQIFP